MSAKRHQLSPLLLLLTLFLLALAAPFHGAAKTTSPVPPPSPDEIKIILADAEAAFSRGENQQAHTLYSKYLLHDPRNQLVLTKRAEVRTGLGLVSESLADWKIVIDIEPSALAHVKRAELLVKVGAYNDAEHSLTAAVADASISSVHRDAVNDNRMRIKECQELLKAIDLYDASKNWSKGLGSIEKLLSISPQAANVRRKRVEMLLAIRAPTHAISELSNLLRSDQELGDHARLADLLYHTLYDVKNARSYIRRCMQLDPEQPKCMAVHRIISTSERMLSKARAATESSAAASKNLRKAKKAVKVAEKYSCTPSTTGGKGSVDSVDSPKLTTDEKRLAADLRRAAAAAFGHEFKEQHAGIARELSRAACLAFRMPSACRAAIARDGSCVQCIEALVDTLVTEFDDFKSALAAINNMLEAPAAREHEELLRALRKKVLGQEAAAGRVDYYEVLGVSRDATQQEIRKAFRERARRCHPDKVRGRNPETAKELMAKINSAYQVLSNAESRGKYNSGFDPNDPNANQAFQQGQNFQNFFQGDMPMNFFRQQQGGGGNDGGFQFHFS